MKPCEVKGLPVEAASAAIAETTVRVCAGSRPWHGVLKCTSTISLARVASLCSAGLLDISDLYDRMDLALSLIIANQAEICNNLLRDGFS